MNKAESVFQQKVRDLGCIVCLNHGIKTDCEIHHLLSGGRRISEMDVLGLCATHHRGGMKTETVVSRHPWRKEFEARYGTERNLLATTRRLVA